MISSSCINTVNYVLYWRNNESQRFHIGKMTFKIIRGHLYWCYSIGHMISQVPTSIPLKLYLCVVQLLRYTHLPQVLSSSWDGRVFGTTEMGRKLGAVPPFLGGEQLGPHLTVWPGPRSISVPSGTYLDPTSHLATTDMGRKLGAVPP